MSLPTSAAFRQYYLDGRAPLVRAVLRLADDTTVQVGGDRIMVGGLSVTGATSPASDFSIGSAIVGTATVMLANYDGWLDLLDLEGATLLAYAGAEVAGGTEWALLGTYDVDAPSTRGMTYPLQCRDYMGRFEVAYSEVTTTYPATLATIVSDICAHVGVVLATPTFTNSTHVVQARPTDELSCIDMLGFVAQLACSYARMTPDGRLSLGWYDPDAFGVGESWLDGGTFSGSQTPYADGDAANGGAFMTGGDAASGGTFDGPRDYSQVSAIRSLTTGAMDVTITGLRVTAQDQVVTEGEGAEGESYQYGQDGYVLAIEGNPLVPYGSAQAVAAMVAPYVVGLSFRPLDSDVIGDPSLQAGDAMVVTDRLGRTYRTYVTQATWSSGGSQRLACGAQAPSRRAMSRTGVVTRAIKAVNDAVRRVTTATQAARQVADEAKSVADAIGQHFWTGDDGVHVTQVTQESWETSPLGPNLLANSLGILLRTGLSNLVSVTQSAIAFYDGIDNSASNIVALFGSSLARVGKETGGHVDMTSSGMEVLVGSNSKANFGSTTRIGIAGGVRTEVTGSGMSLFDEDDRETLNISCNQGEAGWSKRFCSIEFDPIEAGASPYISGRGDTVTGDVKLSLNATTNHGNDGSYLNLEDDGITLHTGASVGGYVRYAAIDMDGASKSIDMYGSVSVTGGMTVGGDVIANNIGTIVSDNDTKSVASGTGTDICSVTLDPGTWLIEGNLAYLTNATGRRIVTLSTTAGNATSASILSQTGVQVPATSGGYTALHTTWITKRTAQSTIYLNAYQDSGGDLSATGYIRAIRIA